MKRYVQDVMTTDVAVVHDSATFKEVTNILESRQVSALPVVDDQGHLLGIVSESDLLLKEEYPTSEEPRSGLQRHRRDRRKAAASTAGELMTRRVTTVRPEAALADAARLLHAKHVRHLPVVDHDGKVVGLVTPLDLLKVFLRPDEEIAAEVPSSMAEAPLAVDPASIEVDVADGVVTLTGKLERRSMVRQLVRLVHAIDGVIAVNDQLAYHVDDTPPSSQPWLGP